MPQPVRPPTYPLTEMEPSWFEQLCWRLLLIEFPGVRFIENPDGGVDAVLTSPDGTEWVRAWQAKRFTGHVKWGECENSYDAALANYGVPHLTFCFARDLTGPQAQTFMKRLGRRAPGVLCDWIGRGQLHRLLTETDQGRATAEFFFERDIVDLATLDRALKMGGVVASTDEAVERLAEVGKFLGHRDPYFEVESSNYAVGRDRGPAPGTVMSLLQQADGRVTRLDIQPTDSESLRLYGPQVELGFTNDEHGERAERILDEALAGRRSVYVNDGLQIRFTRCPPIVREQLNADFLPASLEVTLADLERTPVDDDSAPLPTPEWGGQLSIEGRPELGCLPVAIAPVPPPDGWDVCLAGEQEGFQMKFMSRERQGKRETGFEFGYTLMASRPKDQATVIHLMRAMFDGEQLVIEDEGGERHAIDFGPSVMQQFPAKDRLALRLYDDLVTIEEATACEFTIPDSLERHPLGSVAELAEALRRGKLPVGMGEFEYCADDAEIAELAEGGHLIRVGGLPFEVLGEQIELEGVVALPPLRVVSSESAPDGKTRAKLRARDERVKAYVELDVPGRESRPELASG